MSEDEFVEYIQERVGMHKQPRLGVGTGVIFAPCGVIQALSNLRRMSSMFGHTARGLWDRNHGPQPGRGSLTHVCIPI